MDWGPWGIYLSNSVQCTCTFCIRYRQRASELEGALICKTVKGYHALECANALAPQRWFSNVCILQRIKLLFCSKLRVGNHDARRGAPPWPPMSHAHDPSCWSWPHGSWPTRGHDQHDAKCRRNISFVTFTSTRIGEGMISWCVCWVSLHLCACQTHVAKILLNDTLIYQ